MRSIVGGVLASIYIIVAAFITQDEVRHSHGGWINLRGFGTTIVTAPSKLLLGPVLKALGVREPNYAHLGFSGYSQLILHVGVSAVIVYFLGAGMQGLARFALARL